MRAFRRLVCLLPADRQDGIAIMAAICLPIIIGFAALSVEYGYGW